MRRTTSALTPVLLLLSLAACSGDGGPTDPGGLSDGPAVKADPSFTGDIMEILNRRSCTASGCHGGGQGGLTMTSASVAYANLVGVVSPNSGEVRVIPGNSAGSYVIKKLEGRQSVGERMPLSLTPLGPNDLQNIKNWIDQGARNN
jgi:hypothetical protein